MATINSNEVIASTVTHPPTLLKQNELGGRVQVLKFSFEINSSTNPMGTSDKGFIGYLPKGARVTGGKFSYDAAGGSAVASIGDLSTGTQILSGLSVVSAGLTSIPNAKATYSSGVTAGYGWEPASGPTALYIKGGGSAWATGHYEGHIEFVANAS